MCVQLRYQMSRHLIRNAYEWMNEIPTVPIYYSVSTETAAKGTNLAASAGKEDPVEIDSSLPWIESRRRCK